VDKVRAAIMKPRKPIEFAAPGGLVRLDPRNLHTWKPFRMGRVREDGQFDIIFELKDKADKIDLIRPLPYPKIAYQKDCDWLKSPKKGEIDL
jgi:hypothetical protein